MAEPSLPSDDRLIQGVMLNLAFRKIRGRRGGVVLWSVVGSVFGVGSTTSHLLCERYGYDPHMRVKEPWR